jgi:histone-lysine N-methyltransferase ASH1L
MLGPMGGKKTVKPMFSLAKPAVEFRQSSIAGRGVIAKRAFAPGEVVVPYAPAQRRLAADHPDAALAASSKITLLADGGTVLVPNTQTPGGWLCNHSCRPNATLFSSGAGRIQCTRPIEAGDEVTIFYGWVSHNEPSRDPCRCGAPECRGFINFDLSDEDVAKAEIVDARIQSTDEAFRQRLAEYGSFLESIGQEHVRGVIATAIARRRAALSVVTS